MSEDDRIRIVETGVRCRDSDDDNFTSEVVFLWTRASCFLACIGSLFRLFASVLCFDYALAVCLSASSSKIFHDVVLTDALVCCGVM